MRYASGDGKQGSLQHCSRAGWSEVASANRRLHSDPFGYECNGDVSPTIPRSGKLGADFYMTVRTSIMTALLSIGFLGVLFGQSNRKSAPEPKFTELSREDSARLEQQRAVVAAAAKQRYGTTALTRTKSDLPVLQNLI